MKLIAFDGDNTLWQPLSGVNLSDRTPTDDIGWPNFTYKATDDPLVVQRDDGARFVLEPEAQALFYALKERRLLIGVVSYNHEGNIRRVLHAFGLLNLVDYIAAEWHTNKDAMLARMLEEARKDGHKLSAGDLILVDDDPWDIYRGQCARMGTGFCRFGVDIKRLSEVLGLLESPETPANPG
ncbi:MAG: hypothetical protein IVW55_11595 [Chloroflexi bacterium]|nr:hypothetical protein [Chloroflexota bacterium]